MTHPHEFAPFGEMNIRNPTTAQVVQWMCRLAWQDHKNLEIIRFAQDLCAGVQSGDYASQCLALYNFVLCNIKYVKDPVNVEKTSWSKETLTQKCGDCDDTATLLAALAMALGHNCSFVLASFTPDRAPSHVFTIVNTGKGSMVLDTVANVETKKMLADMTAFSIVRCDEEFPTDAMGTANLQGPFRGWSGIPK